MVTSLARASAQTIEGCETEVCWDAGLPAATPREARPNRPFVHFVSFVREDAVVPSAASVVSAVDVETGSGRNAGGCHEDRTEQVARGGV